MKRAPQAMPGELLVLDATRRELRMHPATDVAIRDGAYTPPVLVVLRQAALKTRYRFV